jgi:hypothetical protein
VYNVFNQFLVDEQKGESVASAIRLGKRIEDLQRMFRAEQNKLVGTQIGIYAV